MSLAKKEVKRSLITLPDDLYFWVYENSVKMGLPLATTVVMLLRECKQMKDDAKRNRENADKMMEIMKGYISKDPAELQEDMRKAMEIIELESSQTTLE